MMACCHLLTPHTLEVPLMLVPIWGKSRLVAKNVESKKIDSRKNNTGPNHNTSKVIMISFNKL